MAIRLPSREYGGASRAVQGSATAYPTVEEINLPVGCARNLGHDKTRYTKLDPNHMARVGPVGSNGEEIPVSLVYGQVEVAARYSQQDCKLDRLLDGIEEEVFE